MDKYVFSRLSGVSRAVVQKMIKNGAVRVNGEIVKSGYALRSNDTVKIGDVPKKVDEILLEKFDLKILYEDKACFVIDKPPGLVVHPGDSGAHFTGTVANKILSKLGGTGLRPGIVHRLDKDTSGCLLIAKNDTALENLKKQFATRQIGKTYKVLVFGHLKSKTGIIDSPIARSLGNRKKMAIGSDGKAAISRYKVLEEFKNMSLLEVILETGRTHQIRVHMAAIGHPVVSDNLYGNIGKNKEFGFDRQFLHAWKLKFKSPANGKIVTVTSKLPHDLQSVLKGLTV